MKRSNGIRLDSLSIGFRKAGIRRRLLNEGLSFQAIPGELTAVIGPNGVGKSTLLRTIVRLLPPLQGSVYIQNRDVESFSQMELARACSFVPAGRIPVARLTVYDIISMARYPHTGWRGTLSDHDRSVIDAAVETLKLNNLAHRFVDELSDGERQRTWIARAVAQETPVIIMDEPTSFLDVPARFEIFRYLRQLAGKQKKAILIATHDIEFVLKMCDKVWLLLHDRTREGAPEDLLSGGYIDLLLGNNEDIRYLPGSGLELASPETIGRVSVSGEDIACRWMIQALERSGFTIEKDINPEYPEIICSREGYYFRYNREEIRFSDIYALTLFLKQQKLPE